jgi:glycosyltransferase involved in cell wall biosynthesis
VDAYVALTEFGRSRFIKAGLPVDKVFVKPNFMPDPIAGMAHCGDEANGAFYAGRISPEKGIETVIDAWAGLEYPLRVAGGGPLLDAMKRKPTGSVSWLGWKSREETLNLVRESAFFVFPSMLYEGFPLALLEAMALGKAIIASDLGPRREMIENGVSGLRFEAGNAKDLRAKIERLINDPALRMRLGQAAREIYLSRYTPEKNYEMLMNIYERSLR